MFGWKLAFQIGAKQINNLGDDLSEMLANFDPETATEVDRENLQNKLREMVTKMVESRTRYQKEAEDVKKLEALIATDTLAADVLLKQLAEQKIDEATLNAFCDELEANKARLPQEIEEAKEAQAILTEYERIVETIKTQLNEFDRHAESIKRNLALAQAQNERNQLRLQQQEELAAAKRGFGQTSTALSALAKRAEKIKIEAQTNSALADIGQAPLDQKAAIDAARAAAQSGIKTGETAAERLARLVQK